MGGARGDGVASSIQSFEILPIILRELKFSVAHVSLVQHPLRASLARECWHSRDVGLLQTSRASATKGVLSVEFAFLYADLLGKPTWMWLAFLGIVIALLTFDLGVLHKKTREIEVKESLILSVAARGLAYSAVFQAVPPHVCLSGSAAMRIVRQQHAFHGFAVKPLEVGIGAVHAHHVDGTTRHQALGIGR